jgi:hypothetical protein
MPRQRQRRSQLEKGCALRSSDLERFVQMRERALGLPSRAKANCQQSVHLRREVPIVMGFLEFDRSFEP